MLLQVFQSCWYMSVHDMIRHFLVSMLVCNYFLKYTLTLWHTCDSVVKLNGQLKYFLVCCIEQFLWHTWTIWVMQSLPLYTCNIYLHKEPSITEDYNSSSFFANEFKLDIWRNTLLKPLEAMVFQLVYVLFWRSIYLSDVGEPKLLDFDEFISLHNHQLINCSKIKKNVCLMIRRSNNQPSTINKRHQDCTRWPMCLWF